MKFLILAVLVGLAVADLESTVERRHLAYPGGLGYGGYGAGYGAGYGYPGAYGAYGGYGYPGAGYGFGLGGFMRKRRSAGQFEGQLDTESQVSGYAQTPVNVGKRQLVYPGGLGYGYGAGYGRGYGYGAAPLAFGGLYGGYGGLGLGMLRKRSTDGEEGTWETRNRREVLSDADCPTCGLQSSYESGRDASVEKRHLAFPGAGLGYGGYGAGAYGAGYGYPGAFVGGYGYPAAGYGYGHGLGGFIRKREVSSPSTVNYPYESQVSRVSEKRHILPGFGYGGYGGYGNGYGYGYGYGYPGFAGRMPLVL